MMKTLMKGRKIVVQTINADHSTTFKKHHIDPNGRVLIRRGGGSGITTIEPEVKPENIFTKGLFRTPYVIYSYGAKAFLKRGDEELPPFSMKTIEEYFDSGIFQWIRNAMKQNQSMILYIILFLNFIGLLMTAGGFGYIKI